jgi:hypothetical protein
MALKKALDLLTKFALGKNTELYFLTFGGEINRNCPKKPRIQARSKTGKVYPQPKSISKTELGGRIHRTFGPAS